MLLKLNGIIFRPGGELKETEDQVDGLKRLLTEVREITLGGF